MGKTNLAAWSWGPHYYLAHTWTIIRAEAYLKHEGYHVWIVRVIGLDHLSDKHAQSQARRLAKRSGLPLFPELRNHMIVSPEQLAQMKAAVGKLERDNRPFGG